MKTNTDYFRRKQPFKDGFAGKTAVILGAASGIGYALAEALVDQNVKLVIGDIDEAALNQARDALIARGGDVTAVRCDVTSKEQIETFADQAFDRLGDVNLLFNNAGVMAPTLPFVKISEDVLRWVFEVNVFGAWNVCSTFTRRLLRQSAPAHIVNTASEQSVCASAPFFSVYAGAKAAVTGFSGILRMELPDHIALSVLCPGLVKTKLIKSPGNRPEQFGGPIKSAVEDFEIGMQPAEVAHRCLKGIQRGDYYIFTHYSTKYVAEEQSNEIVRSLTEQTAAHPEWEAWDMRRIITESLNS